MIKESGGGGTGGHLVLLEQQSLASVTSSVAQTWPEMGGFVLMEDMWGVCLYGDFRAPMLGTSCVSRPPPPHTPSIGKVM